MATTALWSKTRETEADVGGRAKPGVSTGTTSRDISHEIISQDKSSMSQQRRSLKKMEKNTCSGTKRLDKNAKWIF